MHAARRFVTVGGRRAAYLDEGPRGGTPLVLLHGGGFDHADLSWRLTVSDLGGRLRLIAPDMPGYGASAGFGRPHDLPHFGEWLLAFLDALGLDRVDLAGVSMGGGMALWLALEHPRRVRRLVPVCPYGIMDRAPMHPLVALVAQTGLGLVYALASRNRALARLGLRANYATGAAVTERVVSDLMEVARDQRGRRSFDAFLASEIGRRGVKTDLRPGLPGIAAPTLLVTGTADRLVPSRHVRHAAALIPRARLLELPTGHWPMRERPELFNPALASFVTD